MRYALIIAGGSGTRLWPMSTQSLPKQLIPFIDGRSLLEIAVRRLERLLPAEQIYICAGEAHRQAILERIPGMTEARFIGEPVGRDTLNAVGLGTAVLGGRDPEAVVGIFTADHLITPEEEFARIVEQGYALAEAQADMLVTFGIRPTRPATGFGYLQLGAVIEQGRSGAHVVDQFKEKPDEATAREYLDAGPQRYLWNSGMFVWRAKTLLHCIERYAPETYAGLMTCTRAWDAPAKQEILEQIYPQLEKISVDYAVMEPASQDEKVTVAAVPMPLDWLDVGSWPSFAQTRGADEAGNTAAGKTLLMDSRDTLIVSNDAEHLITTIGVEGLIVIHTPQATLVCRADQAERIKQLHKQVGEQFGKEWL